MSETSVSVAPLRIWGRSFLALVLTPLPDIDAWFRALDIQTSKSAGFFSGKPVVLDFNQWPSDLDTQSLFTGLQDRGIRIIAVENVPDHVSLPEKSLLAPLNAGRSLNPLIGIDHKESHRQKDRLKLLTNATLLIDKVVRSGQSIVHPDGDVAVIGSVASGAEISAGGSIHVYGRLLGRAIAGLAGHQDARIFTDSMEAELLAIGGYYLTAEEIDSSVFGSHAQASLVGDVILVKAFNRRKH